jgi:orotate phosphoribosyltransferase
MSPNQLTESTEVERMRAELLPVLAEGVTISEDGFVLSSGERTNVIVDVKRALCEGSNLLAASELAVAKLGLEGIEWDTVGGLHSGAGTLSHTMAILESKLWFDVLKSRLDPPLERSITGAVLSWDNHIVLVDDVTTTSDSFKRAAEKVLEQKGKILAGLALVDRSGGRTEEYFMRELGCPFYGLYELDELVAEHLAARSGH